LNQTGELFIDSPSIDFPINFSANQIQFEQPPTPTPTPTQTETPTPTPTQTPTPTPSPVLNPFISVWRTTKPSAVISLPYNPSGNYSGTIDWGDGTITPNDVANKSHTYVDAGDYIVTINGIVDGFSFQSFGSGGEGNLIEITRWGCLGIRDFGGAFQACINLVLTGVTDTLNLVGVTTLQNMFNNCTSITTINNLDSWEVSGITNMSNMFYSSTLFNQDISSWDVSNVTDMSGIFGVSNFDGNISNWNVSGVTNMMEMFASTPFNQAIGNWNVSNVTNMTYMFSIAASFNQDLSSWCVTNIPSIPIGFDTGATSWILPKPIWGTCPP
jgi:surface protein